MRYKITNSPAPYPARFAGLDTLRGFAMVWMTVFHFAFDLNQMGLIKQNFYHDPLWTWQRVGILSLFLFCAGMGQALAGAQGQSWSRFWRRWAQVAACALLVTAGSWWLYPQSFIYFGVLHGMAVMLLVVRLTAHWGAWLWPLGGAVFAIKLIAASAMQAWLGADLIHIFNSPALNGLGLITVKPITQDYVPLLPWLGVMWWGAAAGNSLVGRRLAGAWSWGPLAWLGRWSLSYYMLHQPVLMGGLMVFSTQFKSG